MLFICYENCSTCKGVEKSLVEKNISYEKRDIKADNPTATELKDWHEKSGLNLKKFFNTSGTVYRELGLKDKLGDMSEDEQYQILATNGMLVKRPIIITDDDDILVGTSAKDYVKSL